MHPRFLLANQEQKCGEKKMNLNEYGIIHLNRLRIKGKHHHRDISTNRDISCNIYKRKNLMMRVVVC